MLQRMARNKSLVEGSLQAEGLWGGGGGGQTSMRMVRSPTSLNVASGYAVVVLPASRFLIDSLVFIG